MSWKGKTKEYNQKSLDVLEDKRKDPPAQGWDDETAEKFCKDLSRHGKVFLKTLADAGGELDVSEIRKAFEAAGIKWTYNNQANELPRLLSFKDCMVTYY